MFTAHGAPRPRLITVNGPWCPGYIVYLIVWRHLRTTHWRIDGKVICLLGVVTSFFVTYLNVHVYASFTVIHTYAAETIFSKSQQLWPRFVLCCVLLRCAINRFTPSFRITWSGQIQIPTCRVTHICVGKLDHHWFRKWVGACKAPSHYLN